MKLIRKTDCWCQWW